jgi:hypothetical protein
MGQLMPKKAQFKLLTVTYLAVSHWINSVTWPRKSQSRRKYHLSALRSRIGVDIKFYKKRVYN